MVSVPVISVTMPRDCRGCKSVTPPYEFVDAVAVTPAEAAELTVRCHVDGQAKSGEMVQRLIDADQCPEPRVLRLQAEGRRAQPLGTVDEDVDQKIDHGDKPESRRDDQDQCHCNRQMYQAMN